MPGLKNKYEEYDSGKKDCPEMEKKKKIKVLLMKLSEGKIISLCPTAERESGVYLCIN